MTQRRGILWLIAGILLAILAAGLAYYAFQQLVQQQEQLVAEVEQQEQTQTVVVAQEAISERSVIRLADISTEERPIEEVPSGAVFKTEDAVGRIATRSIFPGQVLLAQNLAESFTSADIDVSEIITGAVDYDASLGDELVALALPANDRLSVEGILLPGDHVDLLFSTTVVGAEEGDGGPVAVYAIQDSEVLQIIYKPPPPPPEGQEAPPPEEQELLPKTLILAMEPQDAVVLKYAVDTETTIDLALRGRENERIFDVDSVTINTLADRYDFVSPKPLP
jgi:pilus assembly protein CpaB